MTYTITSLSRYHRESLIDCTYLDMTTFPSSLPLVPGQSDKVTGQHAAYPHLSLPTSGRAQHDRQPPAQPDQSGRGLQGPVHQHDPLPGHHLPHPHRHRPGHFQPHLPSAKVQATSATFFRINFIHHTAQIRQKRHPLFFVSSQPKLGGETVNWNPPPPPKKKNIFFILAPYIFFGKF